MTAPPASTYRLQITPRFTLTDAAALVPYLAQLGAGWVYLSPILAAADGSEHGYDVVDPSRVDPARGGDAGLRALAAAARQAGLGILVDIVPNHMGVGTPRENPRWWSVLRDGPEGPAAGVFDLDSAHGRGAVILLVLDDPLTEVLARREVRIDPAAEDDAPHGTARWGGVVLPLAAGTAAAAATDEPDAVAAVLARQHWRLAPWREESALAHRRFFTITSLAGVRVEDPRIFDVTHGEILRWVDEGLVDGLRIDHPDGLVDPGAYLARLAERTRGIPVVVEKILEHRATTHPEDLPGWWRTSGTTGYDALAEIDRVLVDPAGEQALDALDERLREETGLPPAPAYADLVHEMKREVAQTSQAPEAARIVRALPREIPGATEALAELLAAFPVYRSYLPAGRGHLEHAASEAVRRRPELADAVAALVAVLGDPDQEAARRFQQTTGPVMAKGVEDRAFYRYTRLGTLTEVGGDPAVFSLDVPGLHEAFRTRQASWPGQLTALSTHDTKRSEDVRARLTVLAEIPDAWAAALARFRRIASTGHGPFDALLWQAVVGAWPASPERLRAYARKAARESAERTTWTDPDARFEAALDAVVDAAVGPAASDVAAFVDLVGGPGRVNALSAKLLQLAGPGVPDLYQGTELWDLSLVDPDNRRPVDFALRRRMLAEVDAAIIAGAPPAIAEDGAAKLVVVSRALRLRRDHPELFGAYRDLPAIGAAADHAIAFDRGGAVALATRLPVGLAARGGWGDTRVLLPDREYVDVFTGARVVGGATRVDRLLGTYPVALLCPQEIA